jgi:hypothetical protein
MQPLEFSFRNDLQLGIGLAMRCLRLTNPPFRPLGRREAGFLCILDFNDLIRIVEINGTEMRLIC